MVKHASSHGIAVLVTTVSSAFLIELFKPQFPELLKLAEGLSKQITKTFNIPLKPETFTVIIVASLLAGIWGIFFKLTLKK